MCRRCLVLYPVALVTVLVFGRLVDWPAALDPWALWVLPLPAVLELIGEHLGLLRANATRLAVVTVPLGVGCGLLYLRYLDQPSDPVVWGVVVVYAGVCLLTVVLTASRQVSGRLGAAEPLREVGGVDEVARVVAREARDGEDGQQAEREAERPPGKPEPRHGEP